MCFGGIHKLGKNDGVWKNLGCFRKIEEKCDVMEVVRF